VKEDISKPIPFKPDTPPAAHSRRRFNAHLSARGTFAALKYRNYRLWFFGQMLSLVGTWMQATAQGYLIYELTNSPQYLGYVGFAAGVPSWIFMLYGGLIADRIPRRTLLVITQTAMMLLALVLAALTFTGLVQPWQVIVLAFLLGVANAFDAPARIAFTPDLVDDRKDLTNAIALNATMFNSAVVVGPAIGGLTYAAVGPGWCFTLNAISFLPVIIALLMMKMPPSLSLSRPSGSAIQNIRAGFHYVRGQTVVRTIMLLVMFVSLFGISFVALMPAWAVDVLGGGATTNGYLQSARGIGALVGALMLATFSGSVGRGRLITMGSFVFPGLLMLFALTDVLPISLLLLMGIGWGYMIYINSSNALVQGLVPDELRGRVMSIYTLTFFGFMPIGSLLAGAAAERLGEPAAVLLGAAIVLVWSGLVYLRVPELRRSH
jgi:MFS family permease